MTFQWACGDAREELKSLSGVQTFFTDPPYNRGFDYGPVSDSLSEGDYREMLAQVVDCAFDAAAEGGSLFIVHYPEDIAASWPELTRRWRFHDWLTWVYPFNKGLSKKRFTKSSRSIVWLTKGEPRKVDVSRVTQPYRNPRDPRVKAQIAKGKQGTHLYNWWNINVVKNVSREHSGYANQIPSEIIRRCLLVSSEPGDLVADPFSGSYSTARVALSLGRRAWGCDMNPETCRFAESIEQSIPE